MESPFTLTDKTIVSVDLGKNYFTRNLKSSGLFSYSHHRAMSSRAT
jgi:hypothetical protein